MAATIQVKYGRKVSSSSLNVTQQIPVTGERVRTEWAHVPGWRRATGGRGLRGDAPEVVIQGVGDLGIAQVVHVVVSSVGEESPAIEEALRPSRVRGQQRLGSCNIGEGRPDRT